MRGVVLSVLPGSPLMSVRRTQAKPIQAPALETAYAHARSTIPSSGHLSKSASARRVRPGHRIRSTSKRSRSLATTTAPTSTSRVRSLPWQTPASVPQVRG